MGEFYTANDGSGALRLAADLPIMDPDIEAAAGQTYDIASISFAVMDVTPFDGLSDFSLVSQIGTDGADLRGLFELSATHQFDGAVGADVGAVPVPAAVWLLGSGLIGLVGLRHRNGK
jgi:hypothetical protein